MPNDIHGHNTSTPEAAAADQSAVKSAKDDLVRNLEDLRPQWAKSQSTRGRYAIYPFLEAVFDLVTTAQRKGISRYLAKKAAKLSLTTYNTDNLFMAVIHCATPAGAVESRTRSKWARALGHAQHKKSAAEPLRAFIQKQGGINECASRFRSRR